MLIKKCPPVPQRAASEYNNMLYPYIHYTQDDSSFNQYLLPLNPKASRSLRTWICSRIENSKHWKFIESSWESYSMLNKSLYIEDCLQFVPVKGQHWRNKKKESLRFLGSKSILWTLELYWSKDEALAKSKVESLSLFTGVRNDGAVIWTVACHNQLK